MLFIQEIEKNSNKNNILMMFKKVLLDDFELMLLQKLINLNMTGLIKVKAVTN